MKKILPMFFIVCLLTACSDAADHKQPLNNPDSHVCTGEACSYIFPQNQPNPAENNDEKITESDKENSTDSGQANQPDDAEGADSNKETGQNPDLVVDPDPIETVEPDGSADKEKNPDDEKIPENPGEDEAALEPARSLEADGLPNLYQVSDDVYRSGQAAKNGLISAKNLGIRTVLTLEIIALDEAVEMSDQSGLVLMSVPMVPTTVSEDDLVNALKTIQTAEKPVLVHCLHGSDRTGIVVAMFRMVFQNWPKEAAKAEMTSDQFGYHEEFANLLDLLDRIDIDAVRARVFSD